MCVLKSDGADGERVPLHATLKFGRALDNDVRVPVARCSRLHAELTVDGRATLQNHARAANTTVLRGETLKPKEARDVNSGDVFEICGRRFRFEAAVAPAPAPAPSPQQAVDVDLTGAPDSDDEEEPEFSPPESAPQDSTTTTRRSPTSPRRRRSPTTIRARTTAASGAAGGATGRRTAASRAPRGYGRWCLLRRGAGVRNRFYCRAAHPAGGDASLFGERPLLRRSITYMADGSSVMRRDSRPFVAAFSFSFMKAHPETDL